MRERLKAAIIYLLPKEANTENLVKKYRKMIKYCYNCGIKVAKIEGKSYVLKDVNCSTY